MLEKGGIAVPLMVGDKVTVTTDDDGSHYGSLVSLGDEFITIRDDSRKLYIPRDRVQLIVKGGDGG